MANKTLSSILCAALFLASGVSSQAAQIKILVAGAMTQPLKDIGGAYSDQSGNVVEVTRDTTGGVTKRMLAGEKWDLVVVTREVVDKLVGDKILIPEGRADLSRAFISLCIKTGMKAPDISTPEAFKATILAAKKVAYVDPAYGAPSGIYLEAILKKLGIMDAVRAKTVFGQQGAEVAIAVAEGRADVGMTFTPEMLPNKNVTVIGRLPATLQTPAIYSAAATTSTASSKEVQVLLKMLQTPAGSTAITRAGLEPLKP